MTNDTKALTLASSSEAKNGGVPSDDPSGLRAIVELAALQSRPQREARGVTDEVVLIATAAALRKVQEIDGAYSKLNDGDIEIVRAALEAVAPLLAPSPDAQAEIIYQMRARETVGGNKAAWEEVTEWTFYDPALTATSEYRKMYAHPPQAHDAVRMTDDIFDTARDAFHDMHDGDNFDASLRHAIEAVMEVK